MPRKYVDNAMNRSLGRVGMPVGSAVHSRSSSSISCSASPRTYVDNAMNRGLGRVGLTYGTAVESNSASPRTYVDNAMNRGLGRVGLTYGTAVESNSASPRTYVDNAMNRGLGRVGLTYGTAVESNITRTYLDNAMNRELGRVGLTYGRAVQSNSASTRTYVDNAMNRELGRAGLPYGTAVQSNSASTRTYVDNAMNRELGRAGLPYGTAVQSNSASTRTYVDNAMNRELGRAGLPYGTAVQSNSASTRTYVDNAMNRELGRAGLPYGTAVQSNSASTRTYVDNAMNRELGRAGLPYGTAVQSNSASTRTYVDNAMNRELGRAGLPYGTAVQSNSASTRTYVDNAMNRELGRAGLPYGTAVQSKSESPKIYVDNAKNRELGRVGLPHGAAVESKLESSKRYVDNAKNRELGRVGLPHGAAVESKHGKVGKPIGTTVISRKNQLYKESSSANKLLEKFTAVPDEKLGATPKKKVYVDNYFNRKHNRVGLPLGSAPISRKNDKNTNEPDKRKKRVSEAAASADSRCNLADLYTFLDAPCDSENVLIPEQFEKMPDETFKYVLECKQRDDYIVKLLEENDSIDWERHGDALTKTVEKYKDHIIDYNTLQIGPVIGHGGFGEVHLASLESGQAVAVKKLKCQQITKKRLEQFKNEMDIFLQLDHPNIVSIIGICVEVPDLAIVMQYMDMSLFDAIHIRGVPFTDDDKLVMTNDITKGMAYLHFQDIAHCDLKSKNILLTNVPGEPLTDDGQVCAKITDFGLSRMKSDTITSSSNSPCNFGTPLYSAPEIHRGNFLSLEDLKKADIFSLGLLIWELSVEEIPFEDLTPPQLKVQVGEKGLTPVQPENVRLDTKLQNCLKLCWSMDPKKRPSALELAEMTSTFTNLVEKREE